jgi:hypothetical protein
MLLAYVQRLSYVIWYGPRVVQNLNIVFFYQFLVFEYVPF